VNASRGVPQCGRRARYLGALSLVAACAAVFAIPGGASASSVTCGGQLSLERDSDSGPHGVRYHVRCTEKILGYSIHVSKKTDHFTTDPVVLQPNGDPAEDGKAFFCEGPIPGPGFGCPGEMSPPNRIVGSFSTVPARCNPAVRAWATVTTEQLTASGSPFITISHPFGLKPPEGCTSPAKRASDGGPTSALDSILAVFGVGPAPGWLQNLT
jgi:hypothetical protein